MSTTVSIHTGHVFCKEERCSTSCKSYIHVHEFLKLPHPIVRANILYIYGKIFFSEANDFSSYGFASIPHLRTHGEY